MTISITRARIRSTITRLTRRIKIPLIIVTSSRWISNSPNWIAVYAIIQVRPSNRKTTEVQRVTRSSVEYNSKTAIIGIRPCRLWKRIVLARHVNHAVRRKESEKQGVAAEENTLLVHRPPRRAWHHNNRIRTRNSQQLNPRIVNRMRAITRMATAATRTTTIAMTIMKVIILGIKEERAQNHLWTT